MLLSRSICRIGSLLLLMFAFTGCSRQGLNQSCSQSGMFSDQTSCQAGSSQNNCVMTTVQGTSGASMCWRVSGQSSVGDQTQLGGTCEVSPWNVGSWSACSAGITTQTRTVVCNTGCSAQCTSSTKPATAQPCPAMLSGDLHTTTDCTAQSGELVTLSTDGKKYCGMTGQQCPSGWTGKNGSNNFPYTVTEPTIENTYVCNYGVYQGLTQVSSGYHAVYLNIKDSANVPCPTINYSTAGCSCSNSKVIFSKVKKVLCY